MGPEFSKQEVGGEATGERPAEAVRSRRTKYAQPLAWYEARLHELSGQAVPPVRVRAIKRWILMGRSAVPPELPPLDEPWDLSLWWARCMTQRAPDWLRDLAKHRPIEPAAPAVPVAPPVDVTAGPLFALAAATHPAAVPALGPRTGYAGALDRMRTAEAAAGGLYTSLICQASDVKLKQEERQRLASEAEQARRSWEQLVDQLRTMERDSAKILSAAGGMWSADEVQASLEVIHLALREGMRGLLRRVRPKLLGLNPSDQDKVWTSEVENLFAGLRANKFTAVPAAADVAA